MLAGGLDWARHIPREDGLTGAIDHLGEPWAVLLQESRLSTFLALDPSNNADPALGAEIFRSGQITDLQSRLNVFNLIEGGQVSLPALRAFEKLYALLGLPSAEVGQLAQQLRLAYEMKDVDKSDTGKHHLPLLPPQRIEQLVWYGVSASSLQALRPFITLLPERATVNLNTASAEVLSASLPDLDLAGAPNA